MTRTTRIWLAAVSAFLPAAVSLCPCCREQGYGLEVYRTAGGWGYDVTLDGNTVIHQPYSPVLPGNFPFPDRAGAAAAGSLVIEKLSAGESPALRREEVEEILGLG